jgi:outer membrane protein W
VRKTVVIAASLLFVVASAFAQQSSPSNTVSVFVSDLSIVHTSHRGTDLDASYGVAFNHMFSRHLSAELSVTNQPIQRTVIVASASGTTYFTSREHLYPIDASMSYHFLSDSRWKPYVGGGVRYLENTTSFDLPTGTRRFSHHTVDPEITGGVTFQFRPNLGLRFDVKQIIGSSSSILGDSALSGSVGLSFRF